MNDALIEKGEQLLMKEEDIRAAMAVDGHEALRQHEEEFHSLKKEIKLALFDIPNR